MKRWILPLTFLSAKDYSGGVIPRPAFWISLAGGLYALVFCAQLLYLQIGSVDQSPYFGPEANVEECTYTFTHANNFLTFGYWNTGLLQDSCSSGDATDHPYVYNHMPAGPDLVMALLLQATGGDYQLSRALLAIAAVAGFWFLLRFVQILLHRVQLCGAGFVLLFVDPAVLMQFCDRVIYNLAPLLIFVPYVLFHAYRRGGQRNFYWAAVAVAFLSALYIEYATLSAVMFSWVLLYLTGLFDMERKHILVMFAAFVAGIVLHLVQNFLYFGPALFVEELCKTLSNRTLGIPSQQELTAFYHDHGIVHHGSHRPELKTLARIVQSSLAVPTRELYFIALAAMLPTYVRLLGWWRQPGKSGEEPTPLAGTDRILIWALALAMLPLVLFLKMPEQMSGIMGTLACIAFAVVFPMLLLYRRRASKKDLAVPLFIARLAIWLGITILMPVVLFPAFAQECSLRGTGLHGALQGIGQFVLLSIAVREFCVSWPALLKVCKAECGGTFLTCRYSIQHVRNVLPQFGRVAGLLVLIVAFTMPLVLCAQVAIKQFLQENDALADVYYRYTNNRYDGLTALEQYRGEEFMTNINTPTVGFFTKSPGFGVCGPEAVSASGAVDAKKCKVDFNRHHDAEHASPRYFFYFWRPDLFPGFADAMPSGTITDVDRDGNRLLRQLRDNLDANFERVASNSLFHVYDLHKKKTAAPPTSFGNEIR